MLCVMRDIPCPPSPPPRLARIMLIVLVKNSAKSDVTLLQKPGGLLRDSPSTGALQSHPGVKLHFVEQNVPRLLFVWRALTLFFR